jgi:predicted Rossmann fold nucleotide-binding protein DprA/Smf involved in DNA uptake
MESSSNIPTRETQATLLLCGPLVAAKVKDVAPLSTGEFNDLLDHLQQSAASLADLLEPSRAAELLASPAIEADRVRALLGRGFALSLAMEKWTNSGVWVMSREDEGYPERIKQKLKQHAPPLLYGCGEKSLIERGGVAIVGSRDIDPPGVDFTKLLGETCAREKLSVVSGGARGVDQWSMLSALEAGGSVVGVMADSLARATTSANSREPIREGRLTLISPFDPEAGFHVGNAMARNKVIYALADYGVVISSSYNEGGTWAGAVEQLQRFKFVPIFVRDEPGVPEGNTRLRKMGAHGLRPPPWPEGLKAEFERIIEETGMERGRESTQQSLL